MDADRLDQDEPPPGLPLERTTLSWVRTALAAVVVCLLLIRLAVVRGSATVEAFAVVAMFGSASAGLWQRFRQARRAERMAAGESPASPGPALATAVGVVALGIAALYLLTVPG